MNKNKKNVYFVDQLLKKPVKDKKSKSTYPTTLYKKDFIHQIDLYFYLITKITKKDMHSL